MTLARRWIAFCDAPACPAHAVFEPLPDGDRWDYGMALNDLGWDANPARKATFCPAHWTEDFASQAVGGEHG